MCVIMAQPKGVTIPRANLEAGWWTNPDGAGIAYVRDGKVTIEKGFMRLDDFMDAHKRLELDGVPAMFHFRIRTHGLNDSVRTHPFPVENVAVAHNGILDCVEDDDVLSDTQIFIAKYPKLFVDKKRLYDNRFTLGLYIGWSKFSVLFPSGEFVFVNEEKGLWKEGAWYSNSYWTSALARSNVTTIHKKGS